MIKQLGERYANDPLCISVVSTVRQLHGWRNPPCQRALTILRNGEHCGNYEEKLLEVYKKYTDEWGEAFHQAEIFLSISNVLDLHPQFCERVIDYG